MGTPASHTRGSVPWSSYEFLGHAHLDTTKQYLQLVLGHLREDYDAAMPDIAVG